MIDTTFAPAPVYSVRRLWRSSADRFMWLLLNIHRRSDRWTEPCQTSLLGHRAWCKKAKGNTEPQFKMLTAESNKVVCQCCSTSVIPASYNITALLVMIKVVNHSLCATQTLYNILRHASIMIMYYLQDCFVDICDLRHYY